MMHRRPCRRACPNPTCELRGRATRGNVHRHGFIRTRHGRSRRWLCTACGDTFSSNTGTPYHGLHHPRRIFDGVARLSVEGMSKSAIARVTGLSWNTVARWLERASSEARRFTDRRVHDIELEELQADEIRTFVGGKPHPIWVFAAIEVASRLWISSVVGRRSYDNTERLIADVIARSSLDNSSGKPLTEPLLVTSDGFGTTSG